MSGEHDHPDYEEAIAELRTDVDALEAALVAPAPDPPPPVGIRHRWEADYTTGPEWWSSHGVIRSDMAYSHDVATGVVNDPQFGQVVKVDCLPGTSLDTGGCCYGFTDRCSFTELGLCETDSQGVAEFTFKGWFKLPADWCDSEDDVRWRTRTGSYKSFATFGTYDPVRGVMSQPYSNNFAALAWAACCGTIIKGPPSATDYDRDRARPSTFFSCARASGWSRSATPNGTTASMIQRYWHLNPDPKDLATGVGSADKPYVVIERGKWHSIEVYARANTAGQPNGEYKAWYDGALAMHVNDLQLMPSVARGFNVWHNQYFHGGPEGCDTPQSLLLGPAWFD